MLAAGASLALAQPGGGDEVEDVPGVSRRLSSPELGAIFSLNLVQGVPAYFFTVALPVLLRDSGASLEVIGMAYVVWLPWALKWLWAPIFDSRPQIRYLVLRFTPGLLAAVFLSLIRFAPLGTAAPLLLLAALAACAGASLQIALAAEVIGRADDGGRAVANTLQVIGMTTGGVLGGAVLLWLASWIGWVPAILSGSALILVLGTAAFLIRPVRTLPGPRVAPWRSLRSIRVIGLVLLVGLSAAADGFLGARLLDSGHDAVEVGWYLGAFAMLAMLPAATGAGALLGRVGALATLRSLLLLKAALLVMLTLFPSHPLVSIALAVVCFAASASVMTATWQIYMSSVQPTAAASGFALLTSLEAMVLMFGGMAAGQVAARSGYSPIFYAAALAAVLGAAVSPFLLSDRKVAP